MCVCSVLSIENLTTAKVITEMEITDTDHIKTSFRMTQKQEEPQLPFKSTKCFYHQNKQNHLENVLFPPSTPLT